MEDYGSENECDIENGSENEINVCSDSMITVLTRKLILAQNKSDEEETEY
jgi:hypothetical protein